MNFRKQLLMLAMGTLILTAARGQTATFSKATWITVPVLQDSADQSVVVFEKRMRCNRPVKKATLYITAQGIYQGEINGRRVGRDYFRPGFTSYLHRLQYQQYQVGSLLKKGTNRLLVSVAEGWYRGAYGTDARSNIYGNKAALLLQLEITYCNGQREVIRSDNSWRCGQGMIRRSGFYDGELQDTRMLSRCDDRVAILPAPSGRLVAQVGPSVRRQGKLHCKSIIRTQEREQILDFGQNMAGWVQLKIRGHAGDTVHVYHGEMLDRDGSLFRSNLRKAKAEDIYVLNGKLQVLEPRFTYHGFRYAKVTGAKLSQRDCKAIVVYSDLQPAGSYACSDARINKLQHNILWSLRSNFVDIPTDCPQRSERLGWTADAQTFCPTAARNYDVKDFFSKWLLDLALDQGSNGGVPSVIPNFRDPGNQKVKGGVAGWGDAAVLLPWYLYQQYADTALLRRQYPSMKGWVDYVASQCEKQNNDGRMLWKSGGYGDWYAPGDSTSLPYIDQCFFARSTQQLVASATVLGKTDDAQKYQQLLAQVKKNFLETYIQPGQSGATDTQCAYVLALEFELLPAALRPGAAKRLSELIGQHGNHLTTGFLGTPFLLKVLSEHGYPELAYRLLLQNTAPSWLYEVERGATTVWEKWDAVYPDGSLQSTSFNHYAYGAVGQWLYEYTGGIRPLAPGYQKVLIQPMIGGGLTWAKSRYRTCRGEIVCSWKKNQNKVYLYVSIPRGISARIVVPGGKTLEAGAGSYRLVGRV